MRLIQKGSTNITDYVFVQDSSDGTPETGATITDFDLQYVRNGAAPSAKVDATALAGIDSAHSDNTMFEVDGTDQPGLYRVDWPDAAFATGVSQVVCTVKAAGFHPVHKEYQLVDFDPEDATRMGLTALPNANADAAGGLPISNAGGLDLDAMNTNINDIETDTNELQGDWADGGRLDLIVDAILLDTAEIGAAGAGLTAIPWNASWDAEVQSECTDALNAYDPPTRAELTSDISGLDTKIDTIDTNVDALIADLPVKFTKNVAVSNFSFLMVNSTDHVTPQTGETITGTISKDGGAFAALTNAESEIANGMYKVDLTATEMNADVVTLRFTAATSDDRLITIYTQST